MDDLVKQLNEYYCEAGELKEIARNDDENKGKYDRLIKKFKSVIRLAKEVYKNETNLYINLYNKIILCYYYHQFFESLYIMSHKNAKFALSKMYINKAYLNIQESIICIDLLLEKYKDKQNDSIYEKCKRFKIDFTLELKTSEILLSQSKAKELMQNGQYIQAFDVYNQLNKKASDNLEFIKSNNFDEQFRRIQTGNIHAMKINVLNMQIAYLNEHFDDYPNIDFFDKLIQIYFSANELCDINPEYKGYIEKKKDTENNLKIFLNMNKNEWQNILLQYDYTIIRRLMMEIDKKKVIEMKIREEINSKKTALGLVSLGVVAGMVFLFMHYLTSNNLGFFVLIAIILFILLLFSIALTYILRFSEKLSEERFIEIWKLLILKFPKLIINTKNEKEKYKDI